MATIDVDEETTQRIIAKAAAQGVSVSELLRQFMGIASSKTEPRMTDEEFERLFEEMSIDVPPLPADFSRADIYIDHAS